MKASRALHDVHGPFAAKNTASVTPLIPHFAGMDCGSFFFYRDLAGERTATPMICSNDAFKGLKKPFFGGGGGSLGSRYGSVYLREREEVCQER